MTEKKTKNEIEQEALESALTKNSAFNYGFIYQGFIERGIQESEIKPRENVFTYNAWKALGRQVKRGEHGVKICVFVETSKKNKETGEVSYHKYPKSSTVFHVSQTEKITNKGE